MTNIVKYETDRGEVVLSPQIVKQYLVSGDSRTVTDQEVVFFINLCRYRGLNPFLREAYLIKFGDSPATIIVGKDVFTKRAANHPDCAGWQAGVIVRHGNELIEREGSLVLDDETLVGGWAKVYRNSWKEPLKVAVSLREYERRGKDGKPQRSWAEMPATMIRKVALVQALREAFPDEFGGMYVAEEMGIEPSSLPTNVVNVREENNEPVHQAEPVHEEEKHKTKQRNWTRFWVDVKSAGYSSEDVHRIANERYDVTSLKELSDEQFEELYDILMRGGENARV
jgi:phage recombination protein Bet